jgi:murein DD-endopeptidase MepM/ murein hydrolase activator NlpD
LKPETTQKVELVHLSNTHQDVLLGRSAPKVIEQPSGLAKILTLFGSHRSRTSVVMLGLTVLMGILSFPTNTVDNVAVAAESTPKSLQSDAPADGYLSQLRRDVAGMRPQSAGLIAQAIAPRAYPSTVANRTDTNSLQFSGEVSVPIEVAQPKTKTFKPVATAQPYSNPNGGDGEFGTTEERDSTTTGTTTIGFSWPAAGKLTSRYGRRWGRMHKGIDIAGPVGTPINSAADGTVIAAGWNSGGYGNLVEIRHSDGTTTRYGHNSRLSVSVGQTVRQGQQLAEMGSTGHSTGSHLHFEIRPSGGAAVNPISHLPANS